MICIKIVASPITSFFTAVHCGKGFQKEIEKICRYLQSSFYFRTILERKKDTFKFFFWEVSANVDPNENIVGDAGS